MSLFRLSGGQDNDTFPKSSKSEDMIPRLIFTSWNPFTSVLICTRALAQSSGYHRNIKHKENCQPAQKHI